MVLGEPLCTGAGEDAKCPSTYYCPGPAVRASCPAGSFCKAGFDRPVSCPVLASCKGGVDSPDFGVTIALAFILLALALLLRRLVACSCSRLRESRRSKQQILRQAAAMDSDSPAPGLAADRASPGAAGGRAGRVAAARGGSLASDGGAHDGAATGAFGLLVNPHGHLRSFKAKRWRMNLDLQQLGLRTAAAGCCSRTAEGQVALAGVTASLPAGSVTAVLAPPGSGLARSLLRLLAAREARGTTTGSVMINGQVGDVAECVSDVGYVPARALLHPELTVRETLKFYARQRLPRSTPRKAAVNMVGDVLDLLGLLDVQDWRVGGAQSGAETSAGDGDLGKTITPEARRLLSLGVELVADPALLCVENPVDGLPPMSAARVLSALHALAGNGVTVVVALACTRSEIFATFDRVLLLDAVGSTAFLGPPSGAVPYFVSQGYARPPAGGASTVDFLLDILSGFSQPSGSPNRAPMAKGRSAMGPGDLASMWEELKEAGRLPPHLKAACSSASVLQPRVSGVEPQRRGTMDTDCTEIEPEDALSVLRAAAAASPRRNVSAHYRIPLAAAAAGTAMGAQGYTPRVQLGACSALWAFTHRAMVQLLAHPVTLTTDLLLVMIPGLVLGVAYRDYELSDVPAIAQLMVLSVGMASAITATRLFGWEGQVWHREAGMGLSPSGYFLGKITAHLPEEVVAPLVFLLWFYTFSSPRASLAYLYGTLFSVVYCTSGVGFLFSTLLPLRSATVATVLLVVIFAMIAGTAPPLPRLLDAGGPLMRVVVGASYSLYAVEALVVGETAQWPPVWAEDVQALVEGKFGFNPAAGPMDIGVLWGMGAGMRLIALLVLLWRAASARGAAFCAGRQAADV